MAELKAKVQVPVGVVEGSFTTPCAFVFPNQKPSSLPFEGFRAILTLDRGEGSVLM